MKSIEKYIKESQIKERFENLKEEDISNLTVNEVFDYIDYKRQFINENEEEIVFEEIDNREEYLKKVGAVKLSELQSKLSKK